MSQPSMSAATGAPDADAFLEPMRREFHVPEMDTASVRALNSSILEMTSQFPRSVYIGYFYGTGCPQMLPVYLPLGTRTPSVPTVDDLQTDLWIHPGNSVACAVIQPLRQIAMRHGLNGTTEVYSAAMVPQGCEGDSGADIHDINWHMPLHGFKRWRGNVVVVKHLESSCGAYEIISMPADPEEVLFVANSLSR
ncbi:hypothetical protein C8R44DRAFT_731726 [Mycena epipterygia]|nr:hypothetical protein C8R44DRAFT_731726 [Mycena epipterygia]